MGIKLAANRVSTPTWTLYKDNDVIHICPRPLRIFFVLLGTTQIKSSNYFNDFVSDLVVQCLQKHGDSAVPRYFRWRLRRSRTQIRTVAHKPILQVLYFTATVFKLAGRSGRVNNLTTTVLLCRYDLWGLRRFPNRKTLNLWNKIDVKKKNTNTKDPKEEAMILNNIYYKILMNTASFWKNASIAYQ